MAIFETVTIDGQPFESFRSVAQADTYLLAEPGEDAAAWRALTDPDKKGRALVGATRILLRQPLRADVLVDPIPQALGDATILLAAAMANGYDAANTATTASNIKSQRAGSVSLEFFAPGVITGTGGYRFPLSIWELLKGLLGGSGDDSGIGGSMSTGTCGQSIADIPYGYGGYGYDSDPYYRAHD